MFDSNCKLSHRRDRFMGDPATFKLLICCGGFLIWGTWGTADDRVAWIVQAALRAEVDQQPVERSNLVRAALIRDPKSAAAHWARGDVQVRGRWISLDEAAAQARQRTDLQAYRDRRHEMSSDVEGQLKLAEYCRSRQMPAQARAHWARVVSLSPNHSLARERLGQIRVEGEWVDKRQLERQQKQEQAIVRYRSKHGTRLQSLAQRLWENPQSLPDVLRDLTEYRSPHLVPCLEEFFSSQGEIGGRCAVQALSTLTAPEASISLIRHALDFPVESIRKLSAAALKQRDQISFVPSLLAGLQSPLEKSDELAFVQQNQMVWRQRLSFETQNAKNILTFDRVYVSSNPTTLVELANSNRPAEWIEEADRELSLRNREISQRNRQIMDLLVETMGERSSEDRVETLSSKQTPDDWWNWWNDRIESYPADAKQVVARRQLDYVELMPAATRRYDCLAAGTPVWTETGLVAIEKIQPGDLVLAQNQRTGELKFAAVMGTTTRAPEALVKLRLGDETIRATGGHPFWVAGQGWLKARSLKSGMGLHAARGLVVADAVEVETEPAATYNLIVDEFHSFFVGSRLILSHDNTLCEPVSCPIPGLTDDAP